jgi:septal ring factor EnvC (AmiA/AmiB activator)
LRHRAQVSNLLAILERTQRDMPPVMAIRPDDALAAAHVSMLLGTALPRVYGQAAELFHQLETLRRTRQELVRRRAEASRNAVMLAAARRETDQLLAMKARQAEQADAQWGDLAAKLDVASSQAANLEVLFRRVAMLRAASVTQNLVVVAARNAQTDEGFRRRALLRPVVGPAIAGDGAADRAPGISFFAPPSSEAVAPADSEVLFAGRYHNTGQVLILQAVGGYDLVLEGLERLDVRAGDQLLAGEPVGRMPRSNTESRLYFELRQNGKGVSPAPWLKAELRKVTKS